jgi:hypothetical protein
MIYIEVAEGNEDFTSLVSSTFIALRPSVISMSIYLGIGRAEKRILFAHGQDYRWAYV